MRFSRFSSRVFLEILEDFLKTLFSVFFSIPSEISPRFPCRNMSKVYFSISSGISAKDIINSFPIDFAEISLGLRDFFGNSFKVSSRDPLRNSFMDCCKKFTIELILYFCCDSFRNISWNSRIPSEIHPRFFSDIPLEILQQFFQKFHKSYWRNQ